MTTILKAKTDILKIQEENRKMFDKKRYVKRLSKMHEKFYFENHQGNIKSSTKTDSMKRRITYTMDFDYKSYGSENYVK